MLELTVVQSRKAVYVNLQVSRYCLLSLQNRAAVIFQQSLAFTQCCINVGRPSSTLAQHWNSIWVNAPCLLGMLSEPAAAGVDKDATGGFVLAFMPWFTAKPRRLWAVRVPWLSRDVIVTGNRGTWVWYWGSLSREGDYRRVIWSLGRGSRGGGGRSAADSVRSSLSGHGDARQPRLAD